MGQEAVSETLKMRHIWRKRKESREYGRDCRTEESWRQRLREEERLKKEKNKKTIKTTSVGLKKRRKKRKSFAERKNNENDTMNKET